MRIHRIRVVCSWLAAALVLVPLLASRPSLEWNLHVWKRLRDSHRSSPDDDLDRSFAELAAWLPPSGVVSVRFMQRQDAERTFFRLQYALAPRQLVRSRSLDEPLIIEVGPASAATSLTHDARYLMVGENDELRVLRRVEP